MGILNVALSLRNMWMHPAVPTVSYESQSPNGEK